MPRSAFQFALLVVASCLALSPVLLHADESPYDYAKWREFWSFKPVTKPQPAMVKNKSWVRNPIDTFILAKLESQGRTPAPEADKFTLIRRATFDLTGLPPTLEEIDAFIADTSADAYEKLIKRLLDSPHYGERQGRHWLDVVRYEQGKVKLPGIKNTRGELDFRDYIVRSFNSDKPYNQLILEHLAGDLLAPSKDREQYLDQLTATAFLSIGNWFDECTDPNRLKLDIIDEQINAMSKAFMGLTISCARCHDHKFDPITEKDYYALAGIFASTRIIDVFNENWKDGRVRLTREKAMPEEVEANDQLRARVAQMRAKQWEATKERHAAMLAKWKADEAKYRAIAATLPKVTVHRFEAETFAGQSNLKITSARDENDAAVELLEAQTPGDQWVKYELHALAAGNYIFGALYTAGESSPVIVQVGGVTKQESALEDETGGWHWRHRAWRILGTFELREGINTIRIAAKGDRFPTIDQIRWSAADEVGLALQKLFEPGNGDAQKKPDPAVGLTEHLLPLRMVLMPESPYPTAGELWLSRPRTSEDVIRSPEAVRRMIKPYEQLLAITDYDKPADLPIHIGGDTYRVSKSTVPRAVPVLFNHAVEPPQMPEDRSGRLELARWLADAKHPLTSRVMVNRLWQYHFGHGIVDTANDFGSRGSAPTHPQLLDYLAAMFIEEGWSIKKMHFLIMTSATYRQSNSFEFRVPSTELKVSDSVTTRNSKLETRNLFSPFPRRRLEVEAIYDAMLATTGKVARQPSGKPLDFSKSADRMMYVLTSNRSPIGLGGEIRKMFAVFDYDPTGEPIGKRDESTTAAQSLFWLNNPIPKYFAGEFAKQLLKHDELSDADLLNRAWLIALGCKPQADIQTAMLDYLKSSVKEGVSREESWKQICLAIYASNAFRYLD